MGNRPLFSLTGDLGYHLRLDGPFLAYPEAGITATVYLPVGSTAPAYVPDLPNSGRAAIPHNTGLVWQPYLGASFLTSHNSFAAFGAVPAEGRAGAGFSAHAGVALSECEGTNPDQPYGADSQGHGHHFKTLWTYRLGARFDFLSLNRMTLGPELTFQVGLGAASPNQWIGGLNVYMGVMDMNTLRPNISDIPINIFFGRLF
ncbi:MAG: hypothetical protein HQM15_07870 [Deltaproteobacteria bacterium]|nr:hypothetical protein [Deltaproteobacteria bacterium]